MRPVAAVFLIACLSSSSFAADFRLAADDEPELGSFPGRALSLGPGRPVCGRVTFDRLTAARGGFIFVLDSAEPGDEDAVRMSAAVLARRGGLSSRAALAARRFKIPAVALGRGAWDGEAKTLTLSEPVFGPAESAGPARLRLAVGSRPRVLREGDAACVDPFASRVLLPAAGEGEARIAAAEAARAYDGLRDAGALERWLEAGPGPARATALMREILPRALEGDVPPVDFKRLVSASRRLAGESLLGAGKKVFRRACRQVRLELSECPAAADDASSEATLKRLLTRARALARHAEQAGELFGAGDGGVAVLARVCSAAVERRRKSVPSSTVSLEEAARAGGASASEVVELPPSSWDRFLADSGLDEFIERTLEDSSLGLKRKSNRIRERILAARLEPACEAGQAALAAASAGPVLVLGEDAMLKAAPGEVLAKIREAWASSWETGPLGARLRAGLGGKSSGRVRLERITPAEISGLAFSRDPGSGRRGRILIEAAAGDLESLLGGGAASLRLTLESRSGRVLESEGTGDLLSPARLKRLARLVRALDAWQGSGLEIAFSFSQEKLQVHRAAALEVLPPPRPVEDSVSPRPQGQSLPVKTAR